MTESIEDLIKARIKDALWDDVVRKAALQPGAYKPKAAEISTEKAKEGLGEQYAKEYEQAMLGATPAETAAQQKAHDEVKALFAKLSGRLDALFSFHAAPRAHKPEVTVRSNVAAVRMEEATPSAMASADGLAPEEVYAARKNTAQLANREELSQEERKALRRRKKRIRKRQGAERDEAEALRAKLSPNSAAAKRIEARKNEQALADAKRKGTVLEGVVSGGGGSGESGFSRSAKFFRGMQENGKEGAGSAGKKRGAAAAGLDGSAEPPSNSARFKL